MMNMNDWDLPIGASGVQLGVIVALSGYFSHRGFVCSPTQARAIGLLFIIFFGSRLCRYVLRHTGSRGYALTISFEVTLSLVGCVYCFMFSDGRFVSGVFALFSLGIIMLTKKLMEPAKKKGSAGES